MASDAETTDMIYGALRNKYRDSKKYITACEVGNGTGNDQTNRLDFVAMELWPSLGFHIHAFEVKASKGDLKHELENPAKHNVFFPHIDTFSLIAPEGIINMATLPPKWGVYAARDEATIKCLRKPIPLHDDADYDRRMNRSFACSLLRNAIMNSLDRKLFAKDNADKIKAAKEELQESLANGGRIISKYDYEEYMWMRPLCRRLGYYGRPEEEEIQRKQDDASRVRYLLDNARRITNSIDNALFELKEMRNKLKRSLSETEGGSNA